MTIRARLLETDLSKRLIVLSCDREGIGEVSCETVQVALEADGKAVQQLLAGRNLNH